MQSGRVGLGLLDQGQLEHPLGALVGPFWLEATAAVLGKPSVVDAVAETPVETVRVPMPVFVEWFEGLPRDAREVLHDVALAHRQQTELAVSRLAPLESADASTIQSSGSGRCVSLRCTSCASKRQ